MRKPRWLRGSHGECARKSGVLAFGVLTSPVQAVQGSDCCYIDDTKIHIFVVFTVPHLLLGNFFQRGDRKEFEVVSFFLGLDRGVAVEHTDRCVPRPRKHLERFYMG